MIRCRFRGFVIVIGHDVHKIHISNILNIIVIYFFKEFIFENKKKYNIMGEVSDVSVRPVLAVGSI